MNNKIKFYVHNNCDASEIRNTLVNVNVSLMARERLTEEIHGYFHEVGFDVEYDVDGKIVSVNQIQKK